MGRSARAKQGRQQQPKTVRPEVALKRAAERVKLSPAEVEPWHAELGRLSRRIERDRLRQRELVVMLHGAGVSWQGIAFDLGVTRATAFERYRRYSDAARQSGGGS